jgi:hypothetical protein
MKPDVRKWWHKIGRAILDRRIIEAEHEVDRVRKQYKFSMDNLDTLYKMRKEGQKRYGTRKRAVSARANGKRLQRRYERFVETHSQAREEQNRG